jgi:hypothetical protein
LDQQLQQTNEQGKKSGDGHTNPEEDGKREVINIIPQVDLIHKSNRAKHPLSAIQGDVLWSI